MAASREQAKGKQTFTGEQENWRKEEMERGKGGEGFTRALAMGRTMDQQSIAAGEIPGELFRNRPGEEETTKGDIAKNYFRKKYVFPGEKKGQRKAFSKIKREEFEDDSSAEKSNEILVTVKQIGKKAT